MFPARIAMLQISISMQFSKVIKMNSWFQVQAISILADKMLQETSVL